MATATAPEPVELDFRQRGLTSDQVLDLVAGALRECRDGIAGGPEFSRVCAAVMSLRAERDDYREALEKIATGAYTRPGVRDRAREALGR